MRAYGFQNVVLLINGVELTGWADGDDVIDIKRRSDSGSDKVGADGHMMVSFSTDKSGEISFKLQQTSSSNKYLNSLLQLQESTHAFNFTPVNVLCQDTYRQDMATGTVGYIKKPADMTRGVNANTQEWVVVVERLDLLFGDVPDVIAV